jgi:hypothetical protein
MKLPKDTRKELREASAKHKTMRIEWPADAPDCEIGHKYPLSKFDHDARLVVEKRYVAECESGWEARVRLDYDPVRLLFGLKATKTELGDVETEPERVGSHYERLLALEGQQRTEELGGAHRGVSKAEDELAKCRKKGKRTTLAEAALQRAARQWEEVA